MATLNNNEMNNVMNANNETTLRPTTKEELRAIIEKELKRQGRDADLNHIDVSGVTDMSSLFEHMDVRNIKIDKWDTSNVTDMSYMFFLRKLVQWRPLRVGRVERYEYGGYVLARILLQSPPIHVERIERDEYAWYVLFRSVV